MKKRETIGIDFSGNDLRIVHMRLSFGKREIVGVLNRNVRNLDNSAISSVIKSAFEELKAKDPKIISIIPSHMSITKNIEIPSTNPQEIKDIITLQAGRHTPYSREEIIVDCIEIDIYKNAYTKILLLIVRRDVINSQFEILTKAGIAIEKVIFLPEALAWFVPKNLKLETKDSPVSFIHIDENFSDFVVIFKDKATFVRNIPIGAQYLIEKKEEYYPKFTEEIKKSLEAYQSEDIKKNPNLLVLSGAVEELKDLESSISAKSALPVKVVSYLKNMAISNKALKTITEAKHSSFLGAIASVCVWEELKLDLIPKEIKLKKALERRGRDLIRIGIFILTIFVLTFLVVANRIYFKSAYLNELNTKYKSLLEETRKLEDVSTKVSLVKSYLSNRGYSLEVLTALHEIISIDLKLSDIRFDELGNFTIKGTAGSMATVFSFVDDMEQTKYFKDVKTRYTTQRKDGMRDVTDFEINSMLDKKAD